MQTSLAATLAGLAKLPTETYAPGSSTGRFYDPSRKTSDKQPIQGFSAVLAGADKYHYYFLSDNGFGRKDNSADALLRLYEVHIDFDSEQKPTKRVSPKRHITLHDSDRKLTFKIQADYNTYYADTMNPPVDGEIISSRLLTGADIDPESVRLDKYGNFWFGDEFGPFLIKTDSHGKVLRDEFYLPGLSTPDRPHPAIGISNLTSSGGIEGMAINPGGDKLYIMLEKPVNGDPAKHLRIYQFDINQEKFGNDYYTYRLEDEGTGIGDLVAINEHQFLVIERNSDDSSGGIPYKKIFLIDMIGIKSGAEVGKTELVDLMNIDDPDDLNSDGRKVFSFSFATIESLLILDDSTLMLCNDNNFNEFSHFVKIKLDHPLALDHFNQAEVNTSGWTESKLGFWRSYRKDTGLVAWISASMWFLACLAAGARFLKTIGASRMFWLNLSICLVFLGLNTQLDFIQWLQSRFHHYHWYERWRVDRMPVMAATALGAMILLIFQQKYQRIDCGIVVRMGLMSLLVVLFLRDVSIHRLDMILYQSIGVLECHRALELCALAALITGMLMQLVKSSTAGVTALRHSGR